MAKLILRDYQEECVQAHYDWFYRNQEGNPLFVVPTGGGKSLIISEFIKRSILKWPETRFIVLTHVKELIQQNHDEFVNHWGDGFTVPCGIYSAGLGRRDTNDRVLFAGIQSVYKKADRLGHFNVILIDEAHLVPKKGMGRYLTYLAELKKINPRARVCGYTATHFRLDGGYLHQGEGRLFHDVAYNVPIELLVDRGHLVPVVAKKMDNEIDTTGIRTAAGDFKKDELEAAAMSGDMVSSAVDETIQAAREYGRKHWLFFAISKAHAREIAFALHGAGVDVDVIFGDTPKQERAATVARFKEGKLTALVNVGVLTTGFNAPRCDLMAVLRPTKSAALYVQIMGRGMRTFPGKEDCLVLDYGGNVARHGPINRVRPKPDKRSGERSAPTKTCPDCRSIVFTGTRSCPECGFFFDVEVIEIKHATRAAGDSPYDPEANKPKEHPVNSVFYRRHQKANKPPSVRVDYMCGMRCFSEWVCLEHQGYAGRKARTWWLGAGGRTPIPTTTDEALLRTDELAEPFAVLVAKDPKDPRYDVVIRRIAHPVWPNR